MAECFVGIGGGEGCRLFTGSFTVPAQTTGTTVDIGVTPRVILCGDKVEKTYVTITAMTKLLFAQVGDTFAIYALNTGSNSYATSGTVTETGFRVTTNTKTTDSTYYYAIWA